MMRISALSLMVHPRTKQLYEEAHFEYTPSTEDYVLMAFERDTKGNTKQYRIDQMYRFKHIDRDYVIFNTTVISRDFPGNQRTATKFEGFHPEPVFEQRYDTDEGQPRPVAVAETKMVYDIPATKENILGILDGTYFEKTGEGKRRDIVKHNTNFVLYAGDNAKYGGFTLEEFANKHYDDLLFKAINGYYPTKAKPFTNEKLEQPKKDLLVENITTTTADETEKPRIASEEEQKPLRGVREDLDPGFKREEQEGTITSEDVPKSNKRKQKGRRV